MTRKRRRADSTEYCVRRSFKKTFLGNKKDAEMGRTGVKTKRRCTIRQEDNIKTVLTEIKGVELVYVAQDRNEQLVFVNMATNFCVPEGQGFS